MLILPYIMFTDSPARIFVIRQLIQPLFLLLFINLEEKLHQQITVVCKMSFKTFDTFYFLFILLLG